ncbi:hypothetical protein M0R01_00530 [bacterium]|nr:hypothetical protein [bacterium]
MILKKENKIIINIKEIVDELSIISSRDIARLITEEVSLKKESVIDLDFSNIKLVSRSAAHELMLLKNNLEKKFLGKKKLSFVNINPDIAEMFNIVSVSLKTSKEAVVLKKNKVKKLTVDSLNNL